MGVRLTKSYINIGAMSLDNENLNFPKQNAINKKSPQLQTRTTAAINSRFVIDLLAVQTSVEVLLDWINFTTFKYQESADGSTMWADITGNLTAEYDHVQGVYRRKDALTMTSKRYLGIFVPTQTPVDGSTYFRFGSIAVPSSIVEFSDPAISVGYPFSEELTDEEYITNEFAGGSFEDISIGNIPPLRISFTINSQVDIPNIAGANVKQVSDIFRNKKDIVYLDFNLNNSWQSYLVKRENFISASIDTPNLGTVDFGTYNLKVVI